MKIKGFIFFTLFIFGILIYYFNNGTPWGVKEYKHRVLTYLEKKYHQEFVIDQVRFDFFHSRYTSTAHAKSEPDQKFYVNPGPQGKEFWDSYYSDMAARQMKKDWDPVVKEIYPDGLYYSIEMIDYRDRNDGGLPNYIEDATIGIAISLEKRVITDQNKTGEFRRAFELLSMLNEKSVKFGYLNIFFKNKLIQVHPEDSVNTDTDLEKFLQDYP